MEFTQKYPVYTAENRSINTPFEAGGAIGARRDEYMAQMQHQRQK